MISLDFTEVSPSSPNNPTSTQVPNGGPPALSRPGVVMVICGYKGNTKCACSMAFFLMIPKILGTPTPSTWVYTQRKCQMENIMS